MDVYLVGGAVRDILMGKVPKDLDFVVVGATPKRMVDLGFRQVGADFPVFLHPVTGDEYALARTERKSGTGYNGFECKWEGVSLEEDLSRRDLTINSMALPVGKLEAAPTKEVISQISRGNTPKSWIKKHLIDPFDGQWALEAKLLIRTTEAFSEDPLRVLRVARFMARFGTEWSPDYKTFKLMGDIRDSGELNKLTPERVWKETERALMEDHPEMFFMIMKGFGIFPEVDNLHGVEQRADHHPEIDTLMHVMMCLQQAVKLGLNAEERFAVLCHDLGKRVAMDTHGNLHGHEKAGRVLVEEMCDRLKVPKSFKQLAVITCVEHTRLHRIEDVNPNKVMKLFELTDAIRKPERFNSFTKACEADARGRGGFEDREYPQADIAKDLLNVVRSIDTKSIADKVTANHKKRAIENTLRKGGNLGHKINEAIRNERIAAIKKFMRG